MRFRPDRIALLTVVALVAAVVGGAALRTSAADASAATCGTGANGSPGYAYAGLQARTIAHGVRATLTPLATPSVAAGHVAGWIGVGGPGQGPNGESMWLQTGIVTIPGMPSILYVEITRPGVAPRFVPLDREVVPGRNVRLAVLETSHRPDYWRVWVDEQPVTDPIHLPGSTGLWRPIATAESWNGGKDACNAFAFRFERVGVARTKGGSWAAFAPGHTFRDRGFVVRPVSGRGARTILTRDVPEPYAFEAASLAAPSGEQPL